MALNLHDTARILFAVNHEFGIEDCRHMCHWRDLTRPQQQQYIEMAGMLLDRLNLPHAVVPEEMENASP